MSVAPDSGALAITVRAPAKINLFLGVGPVRADGYHPLDTIYQAVSLYDDVTVTDADDWTVEVDAVGDIDVSGVPLDGTNIVVRAGQVLTRHHGIDRRARIAITKGIPVAGGMAGGSADAAATLVALDRLWNLATPDDDLLALAAGLGSDVPFALIGGSARGTGRGEIVEPVPDYGSWWWVVVPSDVGLSTPAVYREYDDIDIYEVDMTAEAVLTALAIGEVEALSDTAENNLASAALALRPELVDTERAITDAGAVRTLLSGSGPTMLGLASSQEHAHRVREKLLEAGRPALVATGPVAGAHVVEYGGRR